MKHQKIRKWVLFFFLLFVAFLVNLPILGMVLNSFKTNAEILSSGHIFPSKLTLENYLNLGSKTSFWTYFKNSLIVAGVGSSLSIIIAAFAGYALSRYSSKFMTAYSQSLLMLQMFPIILSLIPLFIMFRNLDMVNNISSVIILYTTANLPFATWMFKGFFDGIPKELEEAASIDGCGRVQTFLRIILPISGPGIAAVAIFAFLFTWNEYLIANVFLRGNDLMTIPVGIQMFIQQYASDWASLMAAATLTLLPTFIFFLFVQKYMVHGAVGGAVKG